jgi:hypothetical protein
MASSPQYAGRPVAAVAALTTANTNLDGTTGAYVTAYTFTAAASGGLGGRIDAITAKAKVTTTAGMVRIFVNNSLVREFAVSAVTASATVPAWTIPTTDGADANGRVAWGRTFKPGDVITASTEKSEAIDVHFEGGEF